MTDKWTVLLPEKLSPAGPQAITDIAEFRSVDEFGTDPEDLIPHVHQFDAIILRMAELNERVIDAADNLNVISKHGIGLDNVDIEAATKRNIVVCNTPNVNSRAVAEHAFVLLGAVRRNVVAADNAVREGQWEVRNNWSEFGRNKLYGDTLGLFGFGSIGRELADIAGGVGMECLIYDPYVSDNEVPEDVTPVSSKQAFFERSDAVSIHAPLTEETEGAVSTEALRALPETGIVINTARGGIVDEQALYTALKEGEIAGAGLDVLSEEPPSIDHPLVQRDDVIFTPHTAGVSEEDLVEISRLAAENVRTVYEGEMPPTAVNRDSISL